MMRCLLTITLGITFLASTFNCFAYELAKSPDTARILDTIRSSHHNYTSADRLAAKSLNKSGDKLYRNKNYASAFRAYSNSYPNYPNAYSYIMTSDSHWRSIVQFHSKQVSVNNECKIGNQYFSHDIEMDVSQHFEVGFELAILDHDTKLIESQLYKHARDIADCLRQLANFYKSTPSETCVELNKVQACLGEPLIN